MNCSSGQASGIFLSIAPLDPYSLSSKWRTDWCFLVSSREVAQDWFYPLLLAEVFVIMHLPSTHTHTPFHFFVTMARKMSWAALAVTAGILWERFSVEYKSFWKLSLWFPLQNAFLLLSPPCPSYAVGTACSHLTGSRRPGWGSCPLPSAQLCCWDEEILKATACFVEWSTFEFWSGI